MENLLLDGYLKRCFICGCEFKGYFNTNICNDCLDEERIRRRQGLFDYVQEIEEYNKTNGTNLSYGQYTAMLRDISKKEKSRDKQVKKHPSNQKQNVNKKQQIKG